MRWIALPLPIALVLALAAAPAAAGPSWHLGVRAGGFEPAAGDTHDAVYGGDTVVLAGLQVEARFERGWFLALAADRGEVDGELIAPAPGGGFIGTGTPTDLTLTPIALTFGGGSGGERWRFLYGAGPTLLLWEDDNEFFPADGSDLGLHALLGVRRELARVSFAGELRWSTVPDAIGEGGASALFGEDDLGGLALGVVVAFRLGG